MRFFFGSSSASTGSATPFMVPTAPFTDDVSAALLASGGVVRRVGAARRAGDGITVVGISTGEE